MAVRDEDTGANGLPPPPTRPPPEPFTFGAILAVFVATVMALPAAATTFSEESGSVDWQGPSGWRAGLWSGSFVIGVLSMILAFVAIHRERQRGSRSGRTLAGIAVAMASVGSFIWAWPLVVQAGNGL